MSKERDERPLAEIHFAQDLPEPLRSSAEKRVRQLLAEIGVAVAQNIVDLGCTGLALKFEEQQPNSGAVGVARYIRGQMSGSICGLPCYVPRDRYCLVHDTIGGLQAAGNMDGPQAPRHEEALPFMSRELTDEERKKVLGVEAKIAADAREHALAEYGAEPVEDTDLDEVAMANGDMRGVWQNPAPSCPSPQPPFKCPDHTEPDWGCRKCIAQALVEGSGEVAIQVDAWSEDDVLDLHTPQVLSLALGGEYARVELWARVASWSKKVTRD